MEIQPIRTNKDHRATLAEIEGSWGAREGTEAGDRLDVLLALVEIYEAKRWPVAIDESFDPIDVLNYAIDKLGHTQAELTELLDFALPRIRSSLTPASAHGRHDPQDQRSEEYSSRATHPPIQDRSSFLTTKIVGLRSLP